MNRVMGCLDIVFSCPMITRGGGGEGPGLWSVSFVFSGTTETWCGAPATVSSRAGTLYTLVAV